MSQAKIKDIVFQDIDMKLTVNPINNSVKILGNDQAVARAIKNLVFTQRYEIFYRPDQYSGVYDSLFEPNTPFTIEDIEKSIRDVLKVYEPRAQILEVNIFDNDIDVNSYTAKIVFRILNRKETSVVNVFLERLR